MVDVMLMQALLKAVPTDAALLIVGDIDQLPSVCQIASNADPLFAPNSDPPDAAGSGTGLSTRRIEALDVYGSVALGWSGAVDKRVAGATVKSLAQAARLSTAARATPTSPWR